MQPQKSNPLDNTEEAFRFAMLGNPSGKEGGSLPAPCKAATDASSHPGDLRLHLPNASGELMTKTSRPKGWIPGWPTQTSAGLTRACPPRSDASNAHAPAMPA